MDAESQLLADLDAQTKRLEYAKVINENVIEELSNLCQEKDKLITELCDALARYIDSQSEDKLLQRAREAVK